jgi:D-aspartate ligase
VTGQLALDGSVPALVVKRDDYPLHHGTLAVLRSLGRAGVPVHLVSDDRRSPVAWSRYLAGRHGWGDGPAVERLRALSERLGRCVAVAVDDESAALLAEHADVLRGPLLLPAVPPHLPRQLADKAALAGLCGRHGVPTAVGALVETPEQLAALLRRTQPPYVVKVARPWESPGIGAGRVQHAATADHVRLLVARLACPVVVQERLRATPDGDVMCIGHLDDSGRSAFAMTAVKVRSYPAEAGQTCLGRARQDETLVAASLDALRAFGYAGVFDLDWRWDPRDGRYRLLDVNPRVGASFRVAQRSDGVDAVRALHLSLTGRAVPPAPLREGRALVVGQYDALTAPHYVRAGGLRPWLASRRGEREGAWWARDDVRPAAGLLLRGAQRALVPRRAA